MSRELILQIGGMAYLGAIIFGLRELGRLADRARADEERLRALDGPDDSAEQVASMSGYPHASRALGELVNSLKLYAAAAQRSLNGGSIVDRCTAADASREKFDRVLSALVSDINIAKKGKVTNVSNDVRDGEPVGWNERQRGRSASAAHDRSDRVARVPRSAYDG